MSYTCHDGDIYMIYQITKLLNNTATLKHTWTYPKYPKVSCTYKYILIPSLCLRKGVKDRVRKHPFSKLFLHSQFLFLILVFAKLWT